MPCQETTAHAVYLDLGQCAMKGSKEKLSFLFRSCRNLCCGREREEGDEMDESSGGQAGTAMSSEVVFQVWDLTTLRSPSVLEEGEVVVGLLHALNPTQVIWVHVSEARTIKSNRFIQIYSSVES